MKANGHDESWQPIIEITAGQESVPKFPVNILPSPFSTFVEDVADRMQVPADFVAIPLLVAGATMLGRAFRLAPKRHDDWTERACLWGAIISPPGMLKSPAVEEAMRTPRKMQREAYDRYVIDHAEWERGKREDPEPQFDALVVNEATVEAVSRLMAHNPRGMMFHRDELAGWFSSMNKYRARGGDDRQFFLECWSGGAYRVDRASKPPLYVDDLYLSIFGTLQPEVMRKVFHGGETDGMTARFGLLAWPDMPEKVDVVDRMPDITARTAVETRLREMRAASTLTGMPMRFNGMAYSAFNSWLLTNVNRPERRDPAFGAHLAKYPGLFARLALVLHFMEGRSWKNEVDIDVAGKVCALIDGYLEPHARKIYGALDAHPAAAGAARIAAWLREDRVPAFTERAIRRHGWREFNRERDTQAIGEAMALLEARGWIKMKEQPTTARGGRPSKIATVNPAVSAGV